jgi:hypothetical protein
VGLTDEVVGVVEVTAVVAAVVGTGDLMEVDVGGDLGGADAVCLAELS